MIWLAVIVVPLIAACALGIPRLRRLAQRVLVPLAALPALALALFGRDDMTADIPWLLLGAQFGFGEIGRVMLFLTAFLWTTAGVYASGYLADDPRRTRFFVFFALTGCGNLGLTIAQDIVSFYMFFALMTFSAYGLIVHEGHAAAYRAGRIYLIAAIFGEVLLLAALMLAAADMPSLLLANVRETVATHPQRDLIIAFAFAGFGVKAGAVLVHVWLPLAHPVAPAPASALLSGAMIKAGLLGWLHVLPFGAGTYVAWGTVVLSAGLLSAFGAVAIGLAQRDPKTVLAYSSVSQMGVMTAALAIGLYDVALWPLVLTATALFALNHGFAKAALFLGVGIAQRTAGHAARVAATALMLASALAIAGAPWTGGALAKHATKSAATTLSADAANALPLVMALSAVATSMLLTHFMALTWRPCDDGRRVPASMMLAWLAVSLAAVTLAPWTVHFFVLETLGDMRVTEALWPVIAGVLLYAAGRAILRGRRVTLPPGDLVVLLEGLVRLARRAGARVPALRPAAWQVNLMHYVDALAASEARRDTSLRLELRLMRWNNAGVAFAGILLVLALLATL